MKKNILNWMTIFMVAFVSVGFASCGGDDNKEDDILSIVGTWRYDFSSGYVLLTFNRDGTYTHREFDHGQWEDDKNGKYVFVNNNLSFTYYSKARGKDVSETYEVISLTTTQLLIKDFLDSGVTTFTRSHSNNNNSDENDGSADIQKLVNENVTADVKYEYFTFSLELYTYLTDPGKYFAGKSDINYGVEWAYTNRPEMIYSYILDPGNRFMNTTIISSNHYSVVVPIFVWDEDSEKTTLMNMYSFQYRACKQAQDRGEKLTSDEKDLMNSCEKELNKYINEVNAYRGKIFVEIGNKRYYVKSFSK